MSLFKDLFGKPGSPENPALERAMQEMAKNDNAKTRESLYKAILAGKFILQGTVSGGTEARDGKRIADGSMRVAFKTIEHPPGNIVSSFHQHRGSHFLGGFRSAMARVGCTRAVPVHCTRQDRGGARKSIPSRAND